MEIENCAICKASVKPCKRKKKTYNIRSPAPSNGCQFDPKGCWIDTLFGTIWHALKDLLDRRNPDPLSSKQKRQLQPAALKSGYLSRNLPKKQTSKGKKKERNFQPLQSDHYGLLEVNQPVPLPQSLFDGFPHGIRPFFSTKSSSQSKAPIYGPPVQRSWCLLLLGGLKTPKRKKGNGCIPFVGISFLGFVKSPKKKKTTKAIQSSRKFSSSSSSSSPLSPPALAGDSSCRITEKNSSAKKWGTKMSYVNFSKWFYNECIYGILCICIYNII